MPATIGRIFGALLCLSAGEALPAEKAQGITRDGVEILLGLIPALMIQGDRPPHAGQRGAKSEWHVLIALFDSQTGRRIEQAAVLVRAAPLGLSGVEKSLEPMTVAGSVTFGNYFEFSRPGPHLISVSVRISGHSNPIRVSFDHSMP